MADQSTPLVPMEDLILFSVPGENIHSDGTQPEKRCGVEERQSWEPVRRLGGQSGLQKLQVRKVDSPHLSSREVGETICLV